MSAQAPAAIGVTVDRVSKRFTHQVKGEVYAARDVSIDVRPGEFLTLLGPSGCGKTTTLRMIAGFETPDAGRITFAGQDVTRQPANQRGIGFVFQSFNLLPRTPAIENVELPLRYGGMQRSQRHERAREVLTAVGLLDRAHHHPSQLSGGQQQRVAIARALANRPVLVLADEPTGALDTQTSVDIMHLLQRLNRDGITIILVTHEPDIAKFARRILQFRDGRIINAATLSDPAQPGAAGFSDLPKGESP